MKRILFLHMYFDCHYNIIIYYLAVQARTINKFDGEIFGRVFKFHHHYSVQSGHQVRSRNVERDLRTDRRPISADIYAINKSNTLKKKK